MSWCLETGPQYSVGINLFYSVVLQFEEEEYEVSCEFHIQWEDDCVDQRCIPIWALASNTMKDMWLQLKINHSTMKKNGYFLLKQSKAFIVNMVW